MGSVACRTDGVVLLGEKRFGMIPSLALGIAWPAALFVGRIVDETRTGCGTRCFWGMKPGTAAMRSAILRGIRMVVVFNPPSFFGSLS